MSNDPAILIQSQVSAVDNVQDIRQFLFEGLETCYITSYHLYLNGQKLNDFADLGTIADLQDNSTIHMQEGSILLSFTTL